MGIIDIFKKITSRFKKEEDFEDEDLADEDLGEEDLAKEDLGEDSEEDSEETKEPSLPDTKPAHSKTIPQEAPKFEFEEAEAPKQTRQLSSDGIENIKTQLDMIKSKLDLVETHLQNIEAKEQFQKFESERYLQYLSHINDKMSALEKELSELIKKERK